MFHPLRNVYIGVYTGGNMNGDKCPECRRKEGFGEQRRTWSIGFTNRFELEYWCNHCELWWPMGEVE